MKNRSPLVWIGLFAGLFAIQVWIVPMVIRAVTGTEWLKGTREEGGDSVPVSNLRTAAAFLHCNRYLESLHPDQHFEFTNAPGRSWDIGFDRYMIQAPVTMGDGNAKNGQRQYVCRIHYTGGDESDAANWPVAGFELMAQ